MGQGMIHHDRNGPVLSISPAARRLLGLGDNASAVLNDPAHRWQIIDQDGTPLSREQLPCREALTSGQPVLGRIIGVSGSNLEGRRWLLVNAVPLVPEGGQNAVEVFSSLQDITDRITPLAPPMAENNLG